MSAPIQMRGSAERLQKRRISEKVCQKYRIHKDGDVLRFYYFSESGVLEGCKVKTKDKVPPDAPEIESGEELNFRSIDGMYSYCTRDNGEVVHLAAWTDVEVVQ